ncbi:MAG: 4-hydroxy-tetrahydrodipicolinate synthase [Lentisphaeria bacterium]|jgi:4-hydroxy-tetrahydrodipicolinate synthase|nr:4-hydroxy-tetrahydrodipicolinate synthase [Lentisphaeria bacterium]
MQLQGCYTAIVTPFRDGKVDYAAFAKLIEGQLAGGVDGLVPVGTTGESPTVDFDEHMQIIDFVLEKVGGRCPVIVGSGGNSTAEAIELTKHAAAAGADASLQVTPYYNKPTGEGLYRHFLTVAEAGQIPIVLYNVPGRTGCEIPVDVIARLAPHPLMAAVKEAGGRVDRVSAIRSACDITVLSGDDMLTLPMMSLGAKGVISVASNVLPEQVTRLTHAALAGDWDTARELHFRLYPFFCGLFVETNPIPVKAALAMLGQIAEEYRLPMCPISEGARAKLLDAMRASGIAI